MDALTGFLDGPWARRAFLLKTVMTAPWSLAIQDEAPLSLVAVLRGSAAILQPDGDRTVIGPGDVALCRGPDHYVVADDAATAPQIVIKPGQVCEAPDGTPLDVALHLGTRTWGNDADGSTALLTGTYQAAGEVSHALLAALPPVAVIRGTDRPSPLLDVLAAEVVTDRVGQAVVLDRLLDLVLVDALRAWFERPGDLAPAWYRANDDPLVGPALRLLEDHPAEPWTVASLAAAVGSSRAAFARRFQALVGEPPMTFLAGRRLALAADLLVQPGATVGGVARQVGYGSAFSFSTAFKRAYGTSPLHHRQAANAA